VQQHEKLMQQFMQRGANLASPVAIPIQAHIVRKTNGTGGLSLETLNDAIAVMNTKYTSMNMSFYLSSNIHYIDSDELYTLDVDLEDSKLVLNNVRDALNVYFVGSLTSGVSILNGISSFPSANPAENRMIMWNDATSNRVTLAHEMGHYWNLYHTHEEFFGKELVNGSNCTTAGDLVCDTPADPCCYFYDPVTCTYTGTVKDANSQAYTPMVNNLMSYYGLCRDIFTAGQYTRMDAGYTLRTGYMNTNTYTLAYNSTAAAPININVTQANCGINLTWTDNATNEMGYIIEASTSASGPFAAVGNVGANVTSFSISGNLTDGITYYFRVVVANARATYSTVAQIAYQAGVACYCTPPVLNCTDGDVITNVKIEKGVNIVLNHSSECSENGFSVDSTALPVLEKGMTYTLSLANGSTIYEDGAIAWIDYNRNGTFENNEVIFTKEKTMWNNASGTFTIPLSAFTGKMRMRVSLTFNSTTTDACTVSGSSEGYGETEDYWISITCGVIDNVVGRIRCGSGSITLNASGCSGGTINWFTSATGGTAIATGGSFTTPTLSASTNYYVNCASPCSNERTVVTATIIPANISFTNPTEPAGTFQATQTITSATDITTVTNYFAGKSITLIPGFQAGTNEVFTASIQNISCP
jgi:hypothetical protein